MRRTRKPDAPPAPADDGKPGRVPAEVRLERLNKDCRLQANLFLEESLAEAQGLRGVRIRDLVNLLLSRALKAGGACDQSAQDLHEELKALRMAYEPCARLNA